VDESLVQHRIFSCHFVCLHLYNVI
jgi:hypothetical protein